MSRIVGVTGWRKWRAQPAIVRSLAALEPDLVVHGGCVEGADHIAEMWCVMSGVDTRTFRAKWSQGFKTDRSAGPRRNRRMAQVCWKFYPDMTWLAFPGGSGGTENCIEELKAVGFEVHIYDPDRGMAGPILNR